MKAADFNIIPTTNILRNSAGSVAAFTVTPVITTIITTTTTITG